MSENSVLQVFGSPIVATAVLAGGQSRRMGTPKALLSYCGDCLINYHVHSANALGKPVLVCSDTHDYSAVIDAPFFRPSDYISQQGPLSGIAGAMEYVQKRPENYVDFSAEFAQHGMSLKEYLRSSWLLVVTVDSLMGAKDLVSSLVPNEQMFPCADIVYLSRTDSGGTNNVKDYPLLGLYRLGLLDSLQGYLSSGERRVMGFVKQQMAFTVSASVDKGHDGDRLNINTPEEFSQVS